MNHATIAEARRAVCLFEDPADVPGATELVPVDLATYHRALEILGRAGLLGDADCGAAAGSRTRPTASTLGES